MKYWTSENRTLKAVRVDNLSNAIVTTINEIIKLVKDKNDIDLKINYIIPVPPSKARDFQPVVEMAKAVNEKSGIPLIQTLLKKTKSTDQLKEIEDEQDREEILRDAFDVEEGVLLGQNVILFDDLYRSGATLRTITPVLKNKGKAKNVIVITLTKIRTKK